MNVDEAKKLKALMAENAQLKKLVADLSLNKLALALSVSLEASLRRGGVVKKMVTPDQKAVPSISSVCIINRVHRLWKTAARQVPPRKRKRGGFKNQQRSVPQQALYPGHVWSYGMSGAMTSSTINAGAEPS